MHFIHTLTRKLEAQGSKKWGWREARSIMPKSFKTLHLGFRASDDVDTPLFSVHGSFAL